ncbi:HEPN domain-containing protein [Halomonas sp. THAF12]|uniref:HEPN domain-containing protein n=1 Tax=Halomonas sp. B23F22_10 TaxID=3459515 RepID=UPI00373EFC70
MSEISPIRSLQANMKDVDRLLEIHTDIGGTAAGRRYGSEVLNKSAVVMTCANWEAFVETLAEKAIDHILTKSRDHQSVPKVIRKGVASQLKDHKNELKVWDLAADGWKDAILGFRDRVISENISPFNTPKPHNVKELFKKLLDIDDVCANWYWQGMSKVKAADKLKKFVSTRGAIAHRGELDSSITKQYVEQHIEFVIRLSVRTSNVVRDHVKQQTGSYPWKRARYQNFV